MTKYSLKNTGIDITNLTQEIFDGELQRYALWFSIINSRDRNRNGVYNDEECDAVKTVILAAFKKAEAITVAYKPNQDPAATNEYVNALIFVRFLVNRLSYIPIQDMRKLLVSLDALVALDHAGAMNNRAMMHVHGRGGPVNYEAAISLYDQAIALGYAGAMYNRAVMHINGRGGPVNYEAAISLYERAIALGHVDAMNNRAVMHINGQGGAVDYQAAIPLLDQTIAQGYASAMWNRAVMHQQAMGGPVDMVQAIFLFEKAYSIDNSRADILEHIENIPHRFTKTEVRNFLELLWRTLLNQGTRLSNKSITLLQSHMQAEILKKLTTYPINQLFQLLATADHPIPRIVQNNPILLENAVRIHNERSMLIACYQSKCGPFKKLNDDVLNHILEIAYGYDARPDIDSFPNHTPQIIPAEVTTVEQFDITLLALQQNSNHASFLSFILRHCGTITVSLMLIAILFLTVSTGMPLLGIGITAAAVGGLLLFRTCSNRPTMQNVAANTNFLHQQQWLSWY